MLVYTLRACVGTCMRGYLHAWVCACLHACVCTDVCMYRCHGHSFGWAQVRHESTQSGTATIAGQDSPLVLTIILEYR